MRYLHSIALLSSLDGFLLASTPLPQLLLESYKFKHFEGELKGEDPSS